MQNLIEKFKALPLWQRVALGVAALLILLSPTGFGRTILVVTFLVAIVRIYRLRRRGGDVGNWSKVLSAAIVGFILLTLIAYLPGSGESPKEKRDAEVADKAAERKEKAEEERARIEEESKAAQEKLDAEAAAVAEDVPTPGVPSAPAGSAPSSGADCSTGVKNVPVVPGSKGDRDRDGIACES